LFRIVNGYAISNPSNYSNVSRAGLEYHDLRGWLNQSFVGRSRPSPLFIQRATLLLPNITIFRLTILRAKRRTQDDVPMMKLFGRTSFCAKDLLNEARFK